MSIKLAREQIIKFLGTETNEVIAIKGKWGTGKTYLWNILLNEVAREPSKMALKQYSYVSAFGLSSIATLKNSIFENKIPTELIGKPINLETFSNNIIKTLEHLSRKQGAAVFNLIVASVRGKFSLSKDALPVSTSLLYMSVAKTIVCIDDIERKGSKITQNEILGLVSDLKYQKNCKVVLIFNDAAFTKKDKKSYEELREKIIDKEISFNPTPRECLDIIYGDSDVDKNKKIIYELCIKLKISNIRILFTINRLANDLLKLLVNYPEEIIYQGLNSLILYTYCYYSKTKSLPSFHQLKSTTYNITYVSSDKKKSQEKWVSVLQDYGYANTDDFDLVIYSGVMNGYFNQKKLYKHADTIKGRLEESKSRDSYHDAWRLFHESFFDNQNDVVFALNNAFKENYKYLSINDLNATVVALKALGECSMADDLIQLYLDSKKLDTDYIAHAHSSDDLMNKLDPKIKDKIEVMFNVTKTEKSLREVFSSLAGKNSYSAKARHTIEQASTDEIYRLLKETSGDEFKNIIKFGFMIINIKMSEAIARAGKDSNLNKLRVEKYFN